MTVTIKRDPAQAAAREHDLIVIGGGIYGVAMAFEAAQRGLRPLLIERDDFGGATSWNSQRIIHGGLRYLQSLDFARHAESVRARRWWLQNFPDLVRPIPCVMPLYRGSGRELRRPSTMRAALVANDLLSARRNRGVSPECHLPRGRILSTRQTQDVYPAVRTEGLVGSAMWYDGLMLSPQRLLIELLRWACQAGAMVLNYTEAMSLLVEQGSCAGVVAHDRIGGASLSLKAPLVINCAGSAVAEVAERLGATALDLFHPSLALAVLLDRKPVSEAVVAVRSPRPGAATYFLTPCQEQLLAGTLHVPAKDVLDDLDSAAHHHVVGFLEELNEVLGFAASVNDVRCVFRGLLPAARAGTAKLSVRNILINHGYRGGPERLWSVSGVKYTTAVACARHVLTIAGFGNASSNVHVARPPSTVDVAFAMKPPEDLDAASAEAIQALGKEACVRPDDLLRRRTDWSTRPDYSRLASRLIAEAMEWSAGGV